MSEALPAAEPPPPAGPPAAALDPAERRARLHLRLTPEVGNLAFQRMLERFGSAAAALKASPNELAEIEHVGKWRAEAIAAGRDRVDPDIELRTAESAGARVIVFGEPEYPAALRYIHDPPPALYVRGAIAEADGLAVAIVGSRKCSGYGLEQADRLAQALARCGVTIVSGLARGIDAAAHRGALTAGGRTIAVLGSGLAKVYPPENLELADRIAGAGAVISEFPMQADPAPKLFPIRNRVISGLSLGVLVVEAPPKSGALITAHSALEQGRDVFAVPGRVDMAGSRGCHELIKQGAKLVEGVEDVLDALGEAGRLLRAAAKLDGAGGAAEPAGPAAPALPLSDDERRIMETLAEGPLSTDAITGKSGLPPATVNATLTKLELKGLLRAEPGGQFGRRTRGA
jgi:DNA processing protein